MKKHVEETRDYEDNDDDTDAEQTTTRVTHIEITTNGRSVHEIKPKCQHVDDGKIVDLS